MDYADAKVFHASQRAQKLDSLAGVSESEAAEWTKFEAIAVMCRALASLLRVEGDSGSADAVQLAEFVLTGPYRPRRCPNCGAVDRGESMLEFVRRTATHEKEREPNGQ